MSRVQKNLFAVALLLGMGVGSATPASAQDPRGIWVVADMYRAWTLTVINLSDDPLLLVTNSVDASGGQRPPFNTNTTCDPNTTTLCFPLAPCRNVTWKSNTATAAYPHPRWNGTLTVLTQGKDPKWTATLNFREYWWDNCTDNGCYDEVGTWVYLTANFGANPDWLDYAPYNISCSYPTFYNTTYNAMTLSGTDVVVSLYAPYVNINEAPTVDITMVIRQRWPHTELTNGYQDSLVAPCLTYQENNGTWSRLDDTK